jgi:hypothetical protein
MFRRVRTEPADAKAAPALAGCSRRLASYLPVASKTTHAPVVVLPKTLLGAGGTDLPPAKSR